MQGVALGLLFEHAGICRTELGLVESLTEALGSLGHLLVDLLVILGDLIFDQHIRAVALLAVTVVDKRIIKGIDVTGRLPNCRMHKDGAVETDDVLMQQHHALPPILLDIVFQLHAVLPVVVHGAEPVVDVATGKDETVLLAVGDDFLEHIFLGHCFFRFYG